LWARAGGGLLSRERAATVRQGRSPARGDLPCGEGASWRPLRLAPGPNARRARRGQSRQCAGRDRCPRCRHRPTVLLIGSCGLSWRRSLMNGYSRRPRTYSLLGAKEDPISPNMFASEVGMHGRRQTGPMTTLEIVGAVERTGAVVSGPVPLPTHIQKFSVIRSPFIDKDSQEQFEIRTHKRLIDIIETTSKTIDSLTGLNLPSGVEIDIK